MDSIRRHVLWIALLVQALLLGFRLDLLPMWDDERGTLYAAEQTPARIAQIARADVHPPTYYLLLRAWLKLPLPASELARARALSAVLALASTAVLYRLWLRALAFEQRLLFLAWWVFSPWLVLYARIARSYTLQLLVAAVALRLALDFLESPSSRRAMALYVASAAALLYVHYLPGLALVAATALSGLWRRQWRHLAALAAIFLAFLPWLGAFLQTTGLVAETRLYMVTGSVLAETLLKLVYTFVAFHFGETPPPWALALGVALLPALVWAWRNVWRRTGRPPLLFLLVVGVGYTLAAGWVSFPFVGARLLFLLPFYYLFLLRGLDWRRWHGAILYGGLLLISGGGLASYYHKQDFLNKGYLVDFAEIGRLVEEQSRGQRASVLLDRYTSSAGYYLHGAANLHPIEILHDERAIDHALARLRSHHPALVWYLRYSRDLTPGSHHRRLEEELARDFTIRRFYFVPFSAIDRKVMQWLGLGDIPTHLVEVLELRPHIP
ncbi:MAG: hypothetical protein HY238_24315 [Acidobacteria bacterium]|nr:hypothetical protein [Acidobacteriota bacterium]